MPSEIHQRIDADISVGELGGEGVPQPVHQSAARSVAIDSGIAEGSPYAVLQRSPRDAIAVGPDKERERGGQAASPPLGGEEFIDSDRNIPIQITETVRLTGRVRRAGVLKAYDLPRRGDRVGKNRTIDFSLLECTVRQPYSVYWKVKNHGREAREKGQLRGQVILGGETTYESTSYNGSHYVEVYVVKNGVCVAKDRQQVIVQPGMGV